MKKNTLLILCLFLIILIIFAGLRLMTAEDTWLCDDGAWVKHGNPSTEAPTAPCEKSDSSDFLAYNDKIRLDHFTENQEIESPLLVTGAARGSWFFEGSFPVVLVNWDGLIIADGIAQAEGEWMTEDYVSFSVTLTFEKPSYKNNGALILRKDNPSGLPQNDDAFEIPVLFK